MFETRDIGIVLILPIIMAIVLIPTIVFGTNESSYKYGYHAGFMSYQCLSENTKYLAGSCEDGAPSSNDINTDCIGLIGNSGGQDTTSLYSWFYGWLETLVWNA